MCSALINALTYLNDVLGFTIGDVHYTNYVMALIISSSSECECVIHFFVVIIRLSSIIVFLMTLICNDFVSSSYDVIFIIV
jgi:hypothetical protein